MGKSILIAMALFLSALFGQTAAWSQDSPEEAGFFESIKSDMASVAEEGKTLAEENKTLKGQLIGLQMEVEQLEREIKKLDSSYTKEQGQEREQTPQSFNFKGMGSDELVQEAQNIYLSGQLMSLDDVQRLRELHLYELQYQRQELDLELQLGEFLCHKTQEMRNLQIAALEKAIKDNTAKTREITALIAEEKRKTRILPNQVEILKTENETLRQRIRAMKSQAR